MYSEAETARLFAGAPDSVADIARIIGQGGVPDPAQLSSLSPETLNASWVNPLPTIDPTARHPLLRHAVEGRNLAAAAALIAAGADPNYNGSEMPFAAVRMKTETVWYWFPDYTVGNALLALWLKAGGNPDTVSPAFANDLLLVQTPVDNLEGALFLLAAGANPWQRALVHTTEGGTAIFGQSFHERNATANTLSMEVAFRVGRLGHFQGGTADDVAKLVALYEGVAQQYAGSTGPENLAVIWALQRVLTEVVAQTGQQPSGAIAAVLQTEVPPGIGGFFLAPGEIRSPARDDQIVRNDNQAGRQQWND
jgi:hypothetical protein